MCIVSQNIDTHKKKACLLPKEQAGFFKERIHLIGKESCISNRYQYLLEAIVRMPDCSASLQSVRVLCCRAG